MKPAFWLLLLLSFTQTPYAQTSLFGGTNGNGDFENGTTGWVIVNGAQPNKWVVSNNATPGFTGNCIYVSSSATVPYAHNYNVGSSTYSYFYKDVPIPAGTKAVWLVFDYISNGEWVTDPFGTTVNDGLRIYGMNTSTVVTAGSELPGNFFLSGAYYNQPTWLRKQVRYLNTSSFAGSTMRVIFQWNNNNSNGNQPPAGLDNIEMYASCQDMPAPTQDMLHTGGNFAGIVWNTQSGATGYDIRYRKINDPLTVASYTTPLNVPGNSSYSYTIPNLAPGTTYLVEIRPAGLACTEFSAHARVTTFNQAANDDCANAIQLSVEDNTCQGVASSFQGSSPTAGLTSICADGANEDVWFKFVANASRQVIETKPIGTVHYAKNITLFSGSCASLVPVTEPCATEVSSAPNGKNVSRLIADELTVGTTYFVRVNASANNGNGSFRICVYNEPPLPQCPQLLTPANNTSLASVPQEFKWRKAVNATSYRLRIIEQSGGYMERYITDTSYTYTATAGINYTWNVIPYNIMDQSTSCTGFAFTVCTTPAQPGITATGNLLSTSTGYASYQWYSNNTPINGATSNEYTAMQGGVYKVEVGNAGGCKAMSADFNFVATALNEIHWEGNSIRLYPNPVHDELTIHVNGNTVPGNLSAQIVDLNGRKLGLQQLKPGINMVNLKKLPQGVYSVIIRNGNSEKAIRILRLIP